MPPELESFNKSITDINNNWTTTKTLLSNNFDQMIQSKISGTSTSYKNGEHINIDDYKTILNINADGTYANGNLLDLSNIVYRDLINLETIIDEHNFAANGNTVVENNLEFNKLNYFNNKSFYIKNKDKIHGALIQAKSQNENYNYLVSSTINLICGILILFYLIYKIYTPITVEELKTAVKNNK